MLQHKIKLKAEKLCRDIEIDCHDINNCRRKNYVTTQENLVAIELADQEEGKLC